ncbi:MAG: stage II sporulation protein M [Deltaproteobacteria bacterium]|nr:stage II sporulation protein M [Deltaproteobacteria bacterium]
MNAHEMLRQRRGDWDALEDLLRRFSSNHKRAHATPEELSHFASLFRSVCADLDRARAQGLSDDLVDYLNSLAARAHNIFYVAPPTQHGSIIRFFKLTLPLTIRRNAVYVAAGIFLFYAPMLATIGLAASNEDTLYQLIPKKMLENYEKMYERGHKQGRGETQDMAMTGFYVKNNVGIAFTCFATGIFFGVGSLFFLVFNGIMIGAVVGFLSNSPVAMNLLSFIAGHGPFELTAIGLSGGAGLRLGFGALITANRLRGESLRLAALDAVQLVAGAAALLLAAALIEGFFSPSALPMAVKFGFGGVCTLFLFFYLAYWPWRQGRARLETEGAI